MKLNSAAEMMPVSWREFSLLHPFAPKDQAKGYEEIITDLSQKLCTITGYDAISMQPNSGAQGEYAGLLTIADYHNSEVKVIGMYVLFRRPHMVPIRQVHRWWAGKWCQLILPIMEI